MNIRPTYAKREHAQAKPGKYANEKTPTADGITHDSKAEAARWDELCMLERGGAVSELRRQVAYELAPSVRLAGQPRAKPAFLR